LFFERRKFVDEYDDPVSEGHGEIPHGKRHGFYCIGRLKKLNERYARTVRFYCFFFFFIKQAGGVYTSRPKERDRINVAVFRHGVPPNSYTYFRKGERQSGNGKQRFAERHENDLR